MLPLVAAVTWQGMTGMHTHTHTLIQTPQLWHHHQLWDHLTSYVYTVAPRCMLGNCYLLVSGRLTSSSGPACVCLWIIVSSTLSGALEQAGRALSYLALWLAEEVTSVSPSLPPSLHYFSCMSLAQQTHSQDAWIQTGCFGIRRSREVSSGESLKRQQQRWKTHTNTHSTAQNLVWNQKFQTRN